MSTVRPAQRGCAGHGQREEGVGRPRLDCGACHPRRPMFRRPFSSSASVPICVDRPPAPEQRQGRGQAGAPWARRASFPGACHAVAHVTAHPISLTSAVVVAILAARAWRLFEAEACATGSARAEGGDGLGVGGVVVRLALPPSRAGAERRSIPWPRPPSAKRTTRRCRRQLTTRSGAFARFVHADDQNPDPDTRFAAGCRLLIARSTVR